jgi:hypothetical protein
MTNPLNHNGPLGHNIESLNLVAWRIRKERAEKHETEVNRQIAERIHAVN